MDRWSCSNGPRLRATPTADASFDDVLRLVIGITLTGDADQLDRLLTMALDGIRSRER